jgi:general L-amino acid transport system permease protein
MRRRSADDGSGSSMKAVGRWRALAWQALAVAALLALAWFLAANTQENMRLRGIRSGLDFLFDPAGFDIGETLFPFSAGDPYWRAFLAGVVNTLRVAAAGIVLATLLGGLVGVGRLARNALLRWLCGAYVEFFRNLPLLLQLLMWYFLLAELLPPVSEALQLGPYIFLSKSGLSFPDLLGWLAGGGLDLPERTVFNISGGAAVTPEFLALLLGLTLYTAAFIAEIVRSGIQSVSWGQLEAAGALGLTPRQTLRLVVLPQALRVMIPPAANQYLNLTKNSSLAVAIGYPDLVSITNTSLNQTGRAIECIAIMMAIYLVLSLATAFFMNRYNARAAIREG